ncbi:glutamate receptor 2.5-like isoform X2 [Salvia splendens]|uniref:glutamate receptor 2.5-like isoform X2 n=1 Tax=Salvia splendens TaxID=180675 RepID=UPI001C260B88|nr:glutamate receptor 2.5-like isoform X2 [Salvia splendens]
MHTLHLLLFVSCWLVESTISLKSMVCPELQPRGANVSVGVIIDGSSRIGKEQKIAMSMAAKDLSHCLNLVLHIKDLHALNLINHEHIDTIIGTLTPEQAAFLSHLKNPPPIISLSPAASPPPQPPPSFNQMTLPAAHQIRCIASLIAHFHWKNLISISQDPTLFLPLSRALHALDISIDLHATAPVPHASIESELLKVIGATNSRIFVVMHCSYEFAAILFEKARVLGLLEKGFVWIVADEISNLLDSADSSLLLNMEGVLAIKSDYSTNHNNFKAFKSKFKRKYESSFPSEENPTPSIYALRAYDAVFAGAGAGEDSEFLSGKLIFKNGFLSQKPVFHIVNVIGKSYREVAVWSPELGFSGDQLHSIFWPGGERSVPKGWSLGSRERPLRIGVPARGMFNQFVKVTYDSGRNSTRITGFSIEVFEAAVKKLAYDLHYELVPFNGSYDEMVAQVHNKSFDAAVGDTEIMATRYVYVEFSQPYIESGLVMVVTVKPGLKDSKFIALNPFTKMMWLQLAAVSTTTGFVIWLSEFAAGNDQFTGNSILQTICSILWLSVTIISLSQRENIKNPTSKLVLAVWICVTFVVGASFTAVLSSMMTVPRLEPSVREIDVLRNSNAAVGCNANSFICGYLINVLNFKPNNIKPINSIDEYSRALDNGEIKAAFFVAPHAKVFLAKYCNGYIASGPSFKLGGFGFAFQKGSPLAIDISEAILKVSQSGHVDTLEQNMLHHSNCTSSLASSQEAADDIRLGPGPFSGLFLILGCILGFAFAVAVVRLARARWTSFLDAVWASMVVIRECCARFGSTYFGVRRDTNSVRVIYVTSTSDETSVST